MGSITPTPLNLIPVDGRMVPVVLRIAATDRCDPPITGQCKLVEVRSNEGAGGQEPDWQILGPRNVNLRAERNGRISDRLYTLEVRCTDKSGNSSTGTTTVKVPRNG